MKLENLKIGEQLSLGLGSILILVICLGALAWSHTEMLWLQTKTLYDHPHQVRQALGSMEADIHAIRDGLKLICLLEDELEKEDVMAMMKIRQANVSKQLAILFDRYLGPKTDILELQEECLKWNALRKETLHLLQDGRKDQAIARITSGKVNENHVITMMAHLKRVSEFARIKGEQLFQKFTEKKQTLILHLGISLIVIIFATLILSWKMLTWIRNPLRQLGFATQEFKNGDLQARCAYNSLNEFGHLSSSFNTLCDKIEQEMLLNDKATAIADVMLRESDAQIFCHQLLCSLIDFTDSQIAAIFFLNPQNTQFELFESIGFAADARKSFSAKEFEGEFGAALATGKMQHITNIPEDTRFTFNVVGGQFKPKGIVTIPLLLDHQTGAIISLASIKGYDNDAISFIKRILSTMTARVNGVQAFRQMQQLAEELESQNCELGMQRSELTAQTVKLIEANRELEIQKIQLDQASRLKSAFLANMSHELRTPLNSVIALAGVLNRRLKGSIPEEEYSYMEVIERNGKHLLSLINDILDLSRIESGREEIALEEISLQSLVSEVVEMLGPQSRENSTTLLNLVDENLPLITSDSEKCHHILRNLVGNAVKFTEAGKVEISAKLVQDEIYISVHDNGIGILPDQLPYVFEEFRQVDGSSSRRYGGTGLGLAIAKKYASLLQGGITVESVIDKGSTFTLRLPLHFSEYASQQNIEDSQTAARIVVEKQNFQSGVPQKSPHGGACSIMIVEDSEPAIIQLSDILSESGYEVRIARSGMEAIESIERGLPDAVILDLMMPEVDGFEVLKTIRGTEQSAQLPVIILTAKHVTREELSFLKGNNIHQLIQKGDVNRSALLTAVGKMVAPKQKKAVKSLESGPPTFRSGKLTILVVEDNPDNMKTMRALLKNDYNLIEAIDGKDGVEKADMYHPDLILMDLALPLLDGSEALAEIRKNPALVGTPVVAVTASAMKGSRDEILAMGFNGYLSKPIDHNELETTIQKLLL